MSQANLQPSGIPILNESLSPSVPSEFRHIPAQELEQARQRFDLARHALTAAGVKPTSAEAKADADRRVAESHALLADRQRALRRARQRYAWLALLASPRRLMITALVELAACGLLLLAFYVGGAGAFGLLFVFR